MPETIKAKEPFEFYTRLSLSELTGLKATTLGQLLRLIKKVPGSSIYHHTHRFLQQHQFLSPEPPNDFAHWVNDVMGEDELGEKLASIDTVQFTTIRTLREKIADTIEDYLKKNPRAKRRFAEPGDEFHFMKSVSFVLPTNLIAHDLEEFAEILKTITFDSIYFHVFESRLRIENGNNDFSNWVENTFDDRALARAISRLDPYTQTLDHLRNNIVRLIEQRLSK